MNIHGFLNLFKLIHHIFIHMKTSGCIQNNNIIVILLCMSKCCLGYINRLIVITHLKHRNTLLLTINLKLFDCRRSVNIAGNK